MIPGLPNSGHPTERSADAPEPPMVGVCAPVYNEGANIANTVASWHALLIQQGLSFEIVLCDDGSEDDTFDVLCGLSFPELRVVRHASNKGAGIALRTAIRTSAAEWLILIDSDGQFALEDGLKILSFVRDGNALTGIGVRKKQDRLLLVWGSRLTSWGANRVYGSALRDFNCALRVVHGEECRSMWLRTRSLNYGMEISSRSILMGMPILQVPVSHKAREAGRSNARLFRDGWHRLMFIRYLYLENRLIRSGVVDLGLGAARCTTEEGARLNRNET